MLYRLSCGGVLWLTGVCRRRAMCRPVQPNCCGSAGGCSGALSARAAPTPPATTRPSQVSTAPEEASSSRARPASRRLNWREFRVAWGLVSLLLLSGVRMAGSVAVFMSPLSLVSISWMFYDVEMASFLCCLLPNMFFLVSGTTELLYLSSRFVFFLLCFVCISSVP